MNKEKITRKIKENNGVALFVAILIASIALAIGAGVLNITLKQLKLASFSKDSAQAFFSADTGLECALKWDLQPLTPDESIFGYYSSAIAPAAGLSGWWKLDDGFGSIALDYSSGGNNGTLLPAVNGPTWTTGKVGGALSFDGVNDYVKTGVAMSNFITAGEATISVWMKPTGSPKTQSSVYNLPAVVSDTYAWIGIHRGISGGLNRIWVYNYDNNIDSIGIPYTIDTWVNIVLVHSGGNLYAYKDGNLIGVPVASGDTGGLSEDLLIGKTYTNSSGSYYKGKIDDVRIYNRALNATEIKALYDATAGKFADPVGQSNNNYCMTQDITTPSTGWNSTKGWDIVSRLDASGLYSTTTTFDIGTVAGPCAKVSVTKTSDKRTIINSRGYNTCDPSSIKRVERGVRLGPF